MARLFTHPKVPPQLLKQAVGNAPSHFERFQHHVTVYTGLHPTLQAVLNQVIPESVHIRLTPSRQQLLVRTLPPHCLLRLDPLVSNKAANDILNQRLETELGSEAFYLPYTAKQKPPRSYSWASQFLLLGDFLYYLTLKDAQNVPELPTLARVALALNTHQPLKPHLLDADVRVRSAAERRKRGATAELV